MFKLQDKYAKEVRCPDIKITVNVLKFCTPIFLQNGIYVNSVDPDQTRLHFLPFYKVYKKQLYQMQI